jgi:TRAP-type C4-dicarboxylate transport system permease small subunit
VNDPLHQPGAGGTGAIALWTRRALTALVSIIMFVMMILTTADVFGRAVFNTPIKGSFEIITFLLAALIFSSLPLITWDEKHISVSLVDQWLKGPLRRISRTLILTICTIIVAGITQRMWIQGDLMAEGQHITGFLEWPIAPIAYFMAVLSGLSTLILVLLTWCALTGRETEPGGHGDISPTDPGIE